MRKTAVVVVLEVVLREAKVLEGNMLRLKEDMDIAKE